MKYLFITILLFPLFGFAQNAIINIQSKHSDLLVIKNNDTLPKNLNLLNNVTPGIHNFVFSLKGYTNHKLAIKADAFDSIVIKVDFDKNILYPAFYRNYVPGKEYYNKPVVFFVVEHMPEFPGGDEALNNYLNNSVKAFKDSVGSIKNGKLIIQFEVNQEGLIDVARILRGIDFETDYYFQQVVFNMPQWNPGTHRGKPVRVSFTKVIKL